MPRCQSQPPGVSRSARSFICMSTLRVSTSRSVVCNAEARRWKLWVASAGSSNRGDHDGGADQAGRVLLTSRHRVALVMMDWLAMIVAIVASRTSGTSMNGGHSR
jgi:hypothetical protein